MKFLPNYTYSLFLGLLSLCVNGQQEVAQPQTLGSDTLALHFSKFISKDSLRKTLYVLASDSLEGRFSAAPGQKKAANYIASIYLSPPIGKVLYSTDFFQPFRMYNGKTENIIAILPGTSKINEYVLVSAHYDHIGMSDGIVYNGADDNASGSAAIVEMLRAFAIAYSKGYKPKRSIIFVHFSGEEEGLLGSTFFTKTAFVESAYIYANINIDMIGRVDKFHKNSPKYIYSVGSDYYCQQLDFLMKQVRLTNFPQLEINNRYNSTNDPNEFYRRTDSYNFAKRGIPFIFFTSGEHEDYHKASDTADKIEFDALELRTQFIFNLVWELANRPTKLVIDGNKFEKFLRNEN